MKFKRMLQKHFTGYFIYELFNKLHTTEAILEVIMYLFIVEDLIFRGLKSPEEYLNIYFRLNLKSSLKFVGPDIFIISFFCWCHSVVSERFKMEEAIMAILTNKFTLLL